VVQPLKIIKFIFYIKTAKKKKFYLKPTLACQTNANKKNNIGITGITSARGPKTAKTPGNLLIKIVSI